MSGLSRQTPPRHRSGQRPFGRAPVLLALLMALTLIGCRTFDTARPAPIAAAPTGSGLSDPTDPTDPSDPSDLSNLSIAEAAWLALERHPAFELERLTPAMRRTEVELERAVFDTALSGELAARRADRDRSDGNDSPLPGTAADGNTTDWRGRAVLTRTLATGARLEASAAADRSAASDGSATTAFYGLSATQPLLRGAGREVQLARLRQARLDQAGSERLLRAAAELLVAQVERTAWQVVLADRRIVIVEESLRLAEAQRDEVGERIRIGRLAAIELAAVEAEVAQRREGLINARSALQRNQLNLLRLLGSRHAGDWTRTIGLRDVPIVPDLPLDPVEGWVTAALAQRPDLEEARLRLARGEIEVQRTQNGLLPRLDAFVTLGYSGYADSFAGAYQDPDWREQAIEVGLRIERALGARQERALYQRGIVTRQQAEAALRNLQSLIQVDVRAAHIEAQRTHEQIAATTATSRLREAAFEAETEKLRVGKATSLLVAQAQRDLLAARLAEVEAVVNHLIARLELYRAEGSLLDRRGIVLP